jgi:hypothetical protein
MKYQINRHRIDEGTVYFPELNKSFSFVQKSERKIEVREGKSSAIYVTVPSIKKFIEIIKDLHQN